jgi:pyridoxine 5-phosphate synthase
MTVLSVNVNKIALLRNSRGRDFPDLVNFVDRIVKLGVKGITVHPRPDERHITRQDVFDISEYLKPVADVEFNIEGYPSDQFMQLVLEVCPQQCTLVPDEPGQLTSDHGWDVAANRSLLLDVLGRLKQAGIRSSLFLDPSVSQVELVPSVGADRIELYTEDFARHFGSSSEQQLFDQYFAAAARADDLGIGLNAGHDLDLDNLPRFLEIPHILEVSIGHALVVESLEQGLERVIRQYLEITKS